jgi:Zn-dependent M28 family amino/carboxypeptidase
LRWVEFIDDSEAWATGMGCAIVHTADGGVSWESQTRNLPSGAWKVINTVVATKPGVASDDQVIICGHFDSISEDPYNLAPGADDNASGTAAVLEAARVMASQAYERTIKFLCFSGEEMGPYGSAAYVDSVKQAGDVIIGALNLDMIGYVDSAPESVDIISNTASEWLADLTIDCGNAYVPGLPSLKTVDDTQMTSDHSSFWLAGYSALELIEDSPPVYPYYHTTGDTLGNLTQSFATDVVKLAVATLAELAIPDTAGAGIGPETVAAIGRVYPNPFRSSTAISLAAGIRTDLEVNIFDIEGRLVRKLIKAQAGPGRCELAWDGKNDMGLDVSSGVYFVKMRTAYTEASAKVVLLR